MPRKGRRALEKIRQILQNSIDVEKKWGTGDWQIFV
jgi:hypothetical protein